MNTRTPSRTKAPAAPAKKSAPAPAKPPVKIAAPAPKASAETTKAPVAKPAKAGKPVKADKPAKQRLALVRDSFTMPEDDFKLIAGLKAKALSLQRDAKKSELLRAGLQALDALGAADLVKALDRLVPLKPGRPKKQK